LIELDEKELISGLTKGSEDAFRKLVDGYKDRVYNTSLGLLRNSEDAEDISQDVFIEVFRSIEKFRGESSLSTWIYRITVTKSFDAIRRKKRKKRLAFVTSVFGAKEDSSNEPVEFRHPGVDAENRELSGILFAAIEKLPQNQKIAFTLSKLEDLSYKEISDVMNVTVPAVESLLFRAKNNLKALLNNYYSDS
jgi:RNA polymerase sigma-70 factor (ECF subfamily)